MPNLFDDDDLDDDRPSHHLSGDQFAAVAAARGVLSMQAELEQLRRENAILREYKRKYDKLLGQSLEHSQQMVGGLLAVGLEMARLRDGQERGNV
jgi:hypothetical protein